MYVKVKFNVSSFVSKFNSQCQQKHLMWLHLPCNLGKPQFRHNNDWISSFCFSILDSQIICLYQGALPQTTLEVIDLAKFPGHDPGTTLNTWFLAGILPSRQYYMQHPNNIYIDALHVLLSMICWIIVQFTCRAPAQLQVSFHNFLQGFFPLCFFLVFLSIVFLQLEIVSHILAALLTRITCRVH